MGIELIHMDCLRVMPYLPDGYFDLILTDPPYGTMKGAQLNGWTTHDTVWDTPIPPEKIHNIANRVLRKNGKMVLFSQEPYTSELVINAIPNVPVSYRMIWEKDHFANSLLSKKAPVNYFEDIIIFCKNNEFECLHPLREYFQLVLSYIGKPKSIVMSEIGQRADHVFRTSSSQFDLCTEDTYNSLISFYRIDNMEGFRSFDSLSKINSTFNSTFNLWDGKKYKSNILRYKKDYDGYHPTQKPVALLEDLIKTYSNPGDKILDFAMGSGSTGVACINTGRNFIGIEQDEKYFKIAQQRCQA